MKVFKYLLPLTALLAVFTAGSSEALVDPRSPDSYENELIDRDWTVLRDFINSKRTINVDEKDCNLYISGDVRTDWTHSTEKQNDCRILGGGFLDSNGDRLNRNEFEMEFNLRFDYVCDRAWAVARVEFEGHAGVSDYAKPCCDAASATCYCEECCGAATASDVIVDTNLSGSGSKNLKKHGHKRSSSSFSVADSSFSSTDDSIGSAVVSGETISTVTDPSFSSSSSSDGTIGTCVCSTCDDEGFHGSGTGGRLSLKDAYVGYNICCDGSARLDVEVGRHANLYRVFDSEIQFLSRFDGVLVKYSSCWECVGNWYLAWAGFIVDDRADHYAWVAEAGMENVMDYGFDVKYSFIDWAKRGHNRCGVKNPLGFRFRNSQISVCYNFDVYCMPSQVFGAFLYNHSGRKFRDPASGDHHGRQNMGWYVGFEWGKVRREGDWAVKGQYQVVEAFAVPDGDVSGIGRGNYLDNGTFTNMCGNTNYKGWRVEGLYALTDNLTLNPRFDYSREKDKSIGGKHRYTQFLLEVIYAF